MKVSEDFFNIWGGIAGCQHAFPLALAEWLVRFGPGELPRFAAMSAANVARRFGVDRVKGRLAEGFDADITMINLRESVTIIAEELLYRHRISAYVGSILRAVVKGTWVRGHTVYRNGKFPDSVRGKLVKPDRL